MKLKRRERPSIIEQNDGYHINYQRDDGYSALIDNPYFSAVCLGYFPTKTDAKIAIERYVSEAK